MFLFSLNKYPEVELLDHMIVLFSIFLKNLYTVFHSDCTDRQGLPRWQVKNPPANAGDTGDTGSILGREDPLEEKMAAPSNVLAWRIPWTEEPGRPQSRGSQGTGQDWVT